MATTVSPNELKALRAALTLTQGQLAERLGVSRVTVTAWEVGRNSPKGPTVMLLRMLQAEADARTPTSGVNSENLSKTRDASIAT